MDKFKQTLLECKQKLIDHGYHPRSKENNKSFHKLSNLYLDVLFHVSQVGNDEAAANFLEELRNDEELKETVYVAAGSISLLML
jgi:hypothetical protein